MHEHGTGDQTNILCTCGNQSNIEQIFTPTVVFKKNLRRQWSLCPVSTLVSALYCVNTGMQHRYHGSGKLNKCSMWMGPERKPRYKVFSNSYNVYFLWKIFCFLHSQLGTGRHRGTSVLPGRRRLFATSLIWFFIIMSPITFSALIQMKQNILIQRMGIMAMETNRLICRSPGMFSLLVLLHLCLHWCSGVLFPLSFPYSSCSSILTKQSSIPANMEVCSRVFCKNVYVFFLSALSINESPG